MERRSSGNLHQETSQNQGERLKTLGVQTSDFSVYYDLVQALRARHVPFVPIAPGEDVPHSVGVVLTTASEIATIRADHIVAFTTPDATIEAALRLLRGEIAFRQCVIGIDPGERPGIAVLADGKILRLVHATSPETVRPAVDRALADCPAERFLVRVGNGAPTYRDRILRSFAGMSVDVELVDETRSTPPSGYHGNAERDTAAATNIALTPGLIIDVEAVGPVVPTRGELRDIQRKSRVASEGRLTINADLALGVALGLFTLEQALSLQSQKA
jgi:hypothetical protein